MTLISSQGAMLNRTLTGLLSCFLITFCGIAEAQQATAKNCAYDRDRLLALDEQHFDQEPGGWRVLESKPGCELAAADLLHDYREAHKNSGLLTWHEAQLRATGGQYHEAISLMEQSRMPAAADKAGWNAYVDATIAFLSRDKAALEQARVRLAKVQPPPEDADMPPIVDGYMEVKFADGITRKVRWPPNIDVVEGLQRCFDKSYAEAYTAACQQGKN